MITLDKTYEIFKELTPKNWTLFAREPREWEKGKVKDCETSGHTELVQRETGKNLEKCGFGEIERKRGRRFNRPLLKIP